MPITGRVQLDNGITLRWLRFVHNTTQAAAEVEAVRLVTAQHVHVRRCWVV
jgi:hypothetical protein